MSWLTINSADVTALLQRRKPTKLEITLPDCQWLPKTTATQHPNRFGGLRWVLTDDQLVSIPLQDLQGASQEVRHLGGEPWTNSKDLQ